jgi:hypothetical protein
MAKTTQKSKLINQFKSGKVITERQAATRFGVKNLSARVSELRADGYTIYTNQVASNEGKVSAYRLGNPTRKMIATAYKALGPKAFA